MLDALVVGVAAGIVAAGLWAFGERKLRQRRYEGAFGSLSGEFRVTPKLTDKPHRETAVINVRDNVLDVRLAGLPDGDASEGEILMNEQLRGAGHYWHRKGGADLWGFWDVQVRDDKTILVHTTFVKDTTVVVEAFRWELIA
ncbi:MAG: hypothetical protein QOG85_1173 [Gaiellaceae bacterium]|nr:hypothetical protein [Gaiellaceae bacterium]